MTFDEAIEKIDELQGSAGYATCGVPEANNFSGYDVHEYLNAATKIINNLHEEYAPTIEMTQEEYKALTIAKKIASGRIEKLIFLEFMTVYSSLEIEFNSLMQAWLHPESIKVIGENDDTATSSRNRD